MSSVKDIFDTLSEQERKQLLYAFEHQLSQYISLDDGTFIGVHCDHIKHLDVQHQNGAWSVGEDKCKVNKIL